MKNIIVLVTGGTFAAIERPDGVRELGDTQRFGDRLNEIANSIFDNVHIETVSPLFTFSENMTISKWQTILASIRHNAFKYDGIIVTHGSDTLAYTASMIALSTQGYNIPIVLVASAQPIGHNNCNGIVNFVAALQLIVNTSCKGTFVAYSYDNINTQIYLAERVLQSQSFVDRYASFGSGIDFGYIQQDGALVPQDLQLYDIKRQLSGSTPLLETIVDTTQLDSNILVITPHVGLDYSVFDVSKVDTVIVNPYHSASYCWLEDGNTQSLSVLYDKCSQYNIPLILSPCRVDAPRYNSIVNDIIKLCNVSLESTFAKVLWANTLYTVGCKEWIQFVNSEIASETI
ncbi:MAG: asparaginase domain-containing protein [Clostridiales bacterium]|jgi:L-asparaginase|nr:asparaginase domain-containing protein [Clostridiales bacterium]